MRLQSQLQASTPGRSQWAVLISRALPNSRLVVDAELKDGGHLSDDEFTKAKLDLLKGFMPPPGAMANAASTAQGAIHHGVSAVDPTFTLSEQAKATLRARTPKLMWVNDICRRAARSRPCHLEDRSRKTSCSWMHPGCSLSCSHSLHDSLRHGGCRVWPQFLQVSSSCWHHRGRDAYSRLQLSRFEDVLRTRVWALATPDARL